jgi:hypothetical protein
MTDTDNKVCYTTILLKPLIFSFLYVSLVTALHPGLELVCFATIACRINLWLLYTVPYYLRHDYRSMKFVRSR